MRLLLFLVVSTVLMALAAYDYSFLIEFKKRSSDIKEISQDQYHRNQQQHQLYRSSLNSKTAITHDAKSPSSKKPALVEQHSNALALWPHRETLRELRAEVDKSLSSNPSNTNRDTAIDLTQPLRNLNDIQSYNAQLINYLTGHSTAYFKQAFFINIAAVAALFAFTLYVLFREKLRESRSNILRNQQLLERQTESQQSKKMLLSIMEDLSGEKTHADQLATRLDVSLRDVQYKNNEMEQFIYTISHDLKSPLVSISGFATMLSNQLAKDLTEKQAHYLQRILANVNDMESMLGDLLFLSRVSQQSIQKERIDLTVLAHQIVTSFDVQISDIGGSLTIVEPLGSVVANKRLLQQCVSNLIANALAYQSSERPLEIKIDSEHLADQTLVRVHDNGIGIDEKYHQTIFRIFEHLNVNSGTGVGLTIVKTVMEKHDGHVSLSSTFGKGSIFCLHFPNVKQGDRNE